VQSADEEESEGEESEDETTDTMTLAEQFADQLLIRGDNFTRWSRVFINGQKVNTTYINSHALLFDASKLADGDTVCVSQLGSNSTVFRSSNDYIYSTK
jgi:hypothetical protein